MASLPTDSNVRPSPVAVAIARSGSTGGIDLVRGFARPIEPVPVSPGYATAMVVIAVLMALLPLVYIGLIGVVGWLVYLHAVNDVGILSSTKGGRSVIGALLVYAAPIFAGGVVVLFMIKPLFAPRADEPDHQVLDPRRQPMLFAYIERLCDIVGAPVPREIVVDGSINASASFRRGLLSLFTNDLRLTIGMPLAASMDIRSFTGVLAHELGHFSQGFAMRASYLIRTINMWFARVAYERDAWDYALERAQASGGHVLITVTVALARLSIWASRRVLIGLTYVAAAASSMLSKHMEFDADLHEVRVSGSAAFSRTCRRMSELNMAWDALGRELHDQIKGKRIPDDLMALVADGVGRLPPEQVDKRFRLEVTRPSRWYESHPSTGDRIKAAESAADPGVLSMDGPASALFKEFGDVCRAATYNLVSDMFGEHVHEMTFVPAGELLSAHQREHEAISSAEGIVPAEVMRTLTIRPVFLRMARLEPPEDVKAIAERHSRARQAMKAKRESAVGAAKIILEADGKLDQAAQFGLLLRLGLKPRAQDFGVKNASQYAADMLKDEALGEIDGASDALESFDDALRERVTCALRLLAHPAAARQIPNAEALRAECDQLLEVNAVLSRAAVDIAELRRHSLAFEALASRLTGSENMEHVHREIETTFSGVSGRLRTAHQMLENAGYPFPHDRGGISVARALVAELPAAENTPRNLAAAHDLAEGHAATYRRMFMRLIEIARQVENSLKAKAG